MQTRGSNEGCSIERLVDPNARCGASTAAPVFEDWRLLQLSAFCSLQYLDQSLVICFFLALDVCMFLQVSACSWWFICFRFVPCGFGGLQICRQQCIENCAKVVPKSIKIHQKSIQNRPKWCPGALRKRTSMKRFGSFLEALHFRATSEFYLNIFCDKCANLSVIWYPAGGQGAPKIEFFSTKSRKNLKKCCPEWDIRKSLNCWLNFYR